MTQTQAALELEQKQIRYKLKYKSTGLSSDERLKMSRRLYAIHKTLYEAQKSTEV